MTVSTTALATKVQKAQAPAPAEVTVAAVLQTDKIQQKFERLLGQKAPGFMSSILNIVNSSPALQKCEPVSVVSAAAVAAALDLPIDPNLGFAAIVPYNVRKGDKWVTQAQFQMQWKGYVQLAMRAGVYKTINVCEVYEGEIAKVNRFKGEYEFGERTSDKVVGYIAYFSLMNGFEKFLYMSVDEIRAHGKRYSKNFDRPNSIWQTNFGAMAQKTALKRLLSRFGILSIEMQRSLKADQAVAKIDDKTEEFDFDYVDNDGDAVDAEFRQIDDEIGLDVTPEDKALFASAS